MRYFSQLQTAWRSLRTAAQLTPAPPMLWSLESLYDVFGRDVLREAARSPELSQAITERADDLRHALAAATARSTELTTRQAVKGYLTGWAVNALTSAVTRPDLEMEPFALTGYSKAAAKLGAVFQVAFDEGLLAITAPSVPEIRLWP